MTTGEIASLIMGGLLGILAMGLIGLADSKAAERLWHSDAVANGKAEYYLDGNQETQWRWKP